ncbi:GMC family oxidoreductase N-terminal domain-containing protein [Spongisporangium articulatum]|uniref:GMC family oxidoreductase N-terminal domain-containing protein n=1 Tax=Spongisporangium articulatum TaxID=3362603 RepID=A0ABW8AQ73_9ACTN
MRDVVIVGCGGGGPVVATELARWGLDVLVLEAGPRFADPRRDWSRLENDANNPLTGYFRAGPGDRSKPAWSRDLPEDMFVWQVAGVGGTTLHYYGNCPRAARGVFAGYDGPDAGEYDTTHRFPFTMAQLRPYYRWVEATLPVQTAAMGTKEERFLRAAAATGLPVCDTKEPTEASFRPQENCILQPGGTAGLAPDPSFPQASGCTFCGHCLQGCSAPRGAPRNLTAKRSTDNSYVPMMLTADVWAPGGRPAELVTGATVVRVHTEGRDAATRATGVTYEDAGGARHRVDAKVVVLAAGAVETPRLWLDSGLPNPNGWVGRGLTDHHLDWVHGIFDDYTGSSKGASSSARIDFPGYGGIENTGLPPAFEAFSATYSDHGTHGVYTNGSPAGDAGADAVGRLVGAQLLESVSNIDRVLNCLVITDDDVEAENRVQLSPAMPHDPKGTPPRITVKHRQRSARTRRNREFLARKAVELLRAAGARKVYRADWPPLLLHIHSSMRMGHDPSDSVLDEWSESRFVTGLFVADNSALPNSLGGANPTLTTQALATRAAERIMTRYFGGDPWVRNGTPTVSTDPRITDAVLARNL